MARTRRDFLRFTLGSAAWGALAGCATLRSCQETIAQRPTRRNINSLGANDPIIQAYQSAVTQMQALPSSDRRNWTNQARIHLDYCPHGNWLFLPWHRAYLLFFERICRKLSGMNDFALPYWNWTHDPTIPPAFWGAGNPLAHTRAASQTSVASASSVGFTVVDPILNETNFLLFGSGKITAADDQRAFSNYGRLEGTPHNYIHGFVGGDMGNYWSPRDPLFWLHHNMIERCWIEWNFARNHPNTNDQNWQNRTFTEFCDENGNPVSVTVVEGLLYPVFSYQYDSTALALATSNPSHWASVSGRTDEVDSREENGGAAARLHSARNSKGSRAPAFSQRRAAVPLEPRSLRGAQNDNLRAAATPPRSAADSTKDEQRAKQGATVRLEPVRSFAAAQPLIALAERAASARFAIEPGALRGTRTEGGLRTLLAFDGAVLDDSKSFFVRVFIGKPDADAATPESDPHFVGSFSFFEHGTQPDHGTPTFMLDAGPVLRALQIEGGDLEVDVVLTPIENGRAGTGRLTVRRMELRIVRDVVEKAAR